MQNLTQVRFAEQLRGGGGGGHLITSCRLPYGRQGGRSRSYSYIHIWGAILDKYEA